MTVFRFWPRPGVLHPTQPRTHSLESFEALKTLLANVGTVEEVVGWRSGFRRRGIAVARDSRPRGARWVVILRRRGATATPEVVGYVDRDLSKY